MKVFESYRAFKTNSWHEHYRLCDKYYAGFYEPRNWPGTKESRSDMKLHVTSDLIETVYSSILHTVFYSGGENFFDIVSDEINVARQLTERLRFIIHAPITPAGNTSMWGLQRAIRYILKYGIGICSITYDHTLRRPVIHEVSPYDLYWSSSCGPWIDQSPYLFQFTRMPVQQLIEYKPIKGYNIPSESMLQDFSDYTIDPSTEHKRESAELQTGHDVRQASTDIGAKYIDVIRASTKDSIKWLLPAPASKTPTIIFEAPNRMQEQPYTCAVYRPLLNGIGGVSPVALLAPEHHLQQRTTNIGLDLLELHATPPMDSGPGMEKQPVWGPGMGNESLTEGGTPLALPRIPPELFSNYVESRARALRTIGTNEIAISGQPKPSNANRTSSGMELQNAAREERQFGPILEIESTLIVPTLMKSLLADRVAIPTSMLDGFTTQRASTDIDPKILEARMHLEVRGATRMVGLSRLHSTFRETVQYAISPQIQEHAEGQGYTLDFEELNQYLSDVTSTSRKYRLFRKMDNNEAQAYQERQLQQQRAQAEAQMEVEGQRSQNKVELAELQNRGKSLVERAKQAGLSEDRANELLKIILTPQKPSTTEGGSSE